METNREASIGPWVDAQLVRLRPEENWEPDPLVRSSVSRNVVSLSGRREGNRSGMQPSSRLYRSSCWRLPGCESSFWTTPLSPLVDLSGSAG